MTSKYDRLGDGDLLGSIAAIGAATIVLTFAEVEAVVGPLPQDAHMHPAWWGATHGSPYSQPYAVYWRRGYIADRPDFAASVVTFRRVGR